MLFKEGSDLIEVASLLGPFPGDMKSLIWLLGVEFELGPIKATFTRELPKLLPPLPPELFIKRGEGFEELGISILLIPTVGLPVLDTQNLPRLLALSKRSSLMAMSPWKFIRCLRNKRRQKRQSMPSTNT